MGVFGIVQGSGGGRLPGYAIQIYIPGSGRIPGDDVTTTARTDDRNYERNLYQPGDYQVVVSDGTRELSPRATIHINFIDQCDVKEGQAGSQWVQVNFRKN